MYKIRKAKIVDLDRLYNLHKKMDEEETSLGCEFSNKINKTYLEKMIKNKKCKFFVCIKKNKIIAFGYGERMDKKKILLHNFYTLKNYRNKGIANKVYTKILDSFRNIEEIEAYILDKNKPALEFWQRKGFRVISKLSNAFKVGKSISSNN